MTMKAFLVLLLATCCLAESLSPQRLPTKQELQIFSRKVQALLAGFPKDDVALSASSEFTSQAYGDTCNQQGLYLKLASSGLGPKIQQCSSLPIQDPTQTWTSWCHGSCPDVWRSFLEICIHYDCNFFYFAECQQNSDCFTDEVCDQQHCRTDCTLSAGSCFPGDNCTGSALDPNVLVCIDPYEITIDPVAAWQSTVYMFTELICSKNANDVYCMDIITNLTYVTPSTSLDCNWLYNMGCCLPTMWNMTTYCASGYSGVYVPTTTFYWSNFTDLCPQLDYTTPCAGVQSAAYCCTGQTMCVGSAAAGLVPMLLLVVVLTFLGLRSSK